MRCYPDTRWLKRADHPARQFVAGEEIPDGWELCEAPPIRPVADDHKHEAADYEVGGVPFDMPSRADLSKFDHDGNGFPGGSLPKSKRKRK